MHNPVTRILISTLLLLFAYTATYAQGKGETALPSFVVIAEGDSLPEFSDEELWDRGIAVTFKVNKTYILPNDRNYRRIVSALLNIPPEFTFCKLLVIRGSASPEGPADNNKRLAHNRARAITDSLRRYVTIPDSVVEERYIDEDYIGLRRLLVGTQFKYKDKVIALIDSIDNPARLKRALQKIDRGEAWRLLLRDYYPQLRASRIVIVLGRNPKVEARVKEPVVVPTLMPSLPEPLRIGIANEEPLQPRRELISIKTNLLLYAAWVPNYGFCPMPNVALEYYPLRGHWTFGGSFDLPWWQSSAYDDKTETTTGEDHKFFQIRQYQLFARWYSHDGGTVDGFHGFYIYPYVNLAVFGIGFKWDKGWKGEGAGGGIGIGYKLPLGRLAGNSGRPRSKASHWHLEFSAQIGAFAYKYDPYQYTCIVDGYNNDRYYYRYAGDISLFRKRNHHKVWFGPTRVGITLSYDIIYRSRKSSGKKGGAR